MDQTLINEINTKRNQLIDSINWKQDSIDRKILIDNNLPLKDNQINIDNFLIALHDIENQPSYPNNIIWPIKPER